MTPWWLLLAHLAIPAVLLSIGHGYRNLEPGSRRLFWGGVLGYGAAVVAVTLLLVLPPVNWASEGDARWAAIVWTPLLLPILSAVTFRVLAGGGRR